MNVAIIYMIISKPENYNRLLEQGLEKENLGLILNRPKQPWQPGSQLWGRPACSLASGVLLR